MIVRGGELQTHASQNLPGNSAAYTATASASRTRTNLLPQTPPAPAQLQKPAANAGSGMQSARAVQYTVLRESPNVQSHKVLS